MYQNDLHGESTLKRLIAVEEELRRTRRLFRAVIAGALLACSICLFANSTTVRATHDERKPSSYKASRLDIVDDAGRSRISLAAGSFQFPFIAMNDTQGKKVLEIGYSRAGYDEYLPGLSLFGPNGLLSAWLTMEASSPQLVFFDKGQNVRLSVGVSDDGPRIEMFGASKAEKPHDKVLLTVPKGGKPSIKVVHEDKTLWSAP